MGDTVAGHKINKQSAFENGNAICKAALRPFRKKVAFLNILGFLQIFATHMYMD